MLLRGEKIWIYSMDNNIVCVCKYKRYHMSETTIHCDLSHKQKFRIQLSIPVSHIRPQLFLFLVVIFFNLKKYISTEMSLKFRFQKIVNFILFLLFRLKPWPNYSDERHLENHLPQQLSISLHLDLENRPMNSVWFLHFFAAAAAVATWEHSNPQ